MRTSNDRTRPRGEALAHAKRAAQYVGFGRRTIERAIDLGVIPFKWRGGERLITAEDARLFRAKLIELARDESLK